MPVATIDDAPRFESGAISFRVLATPSRGTKEISAWRAELAPLASSGLHSLDHEQRMIVSNGEVSLHLGGDVVVGLPGDLLILPGGRSSSFATRL